MVVPAPPVIPGDDDGGVGPQRAVADRVHNGGHPGRSAAIVGKGMIGGLTARNDPRDLREVAFGDVCQDLRLRDDDVVGPIRALAAEHAADGLLLAYVFDGVRSAPYGTCRGRVVTPA